MKKLKESEQLLIDIYNSQLADTGDRTLYPCEQINNYFKSKGIDIIELEDQWEME